MRTISVVQHKGGVGKTTLAVNVAAGLADTGKTVVLVDLDPQGSATDYLAVEAPEDAPHLVDVLEGRARAADAAVDVGSVPRLRVIPGDLHLAQLDRALDPDRPEDPKRVSTALRDVADVAVIDTPPGWGMLTVNALVAADLVIAPVETKTLALHALRSLLRLLDGVKAKHRTRWRSPVLAPFRTLRTRLSRECLEALESRFPRDLLPPVRESARVAEAPGFHLPVARFAPDSIGAEDFKTLTRAVSRRLKG